MEKSQFIDVSTPGWWLLELRLDPPLDEMRRKVGACWAWTDSDGWFAKPDSLSQVFQFLVDNKRALLDELDQPQDVYQREKWCQDLIEARTPGQEPAEQPAGRGAAPAGGQSPAAPPPAPPPKRVSAFGPKAADQIQASQPAEAAEARAAVETAEPRKPSPFARKAAPTAEPVPPSPAAGGDESPPPPPPTLAELEDTLSGLVENPAIPISKEEFQEAVQDPDFGAKLAAAESELEAELAAELEAELAAELASAEAEE
jgi:hypothetical protein